jgi:hypothetical protein
LASNCIISPEVTILGVGVTVGVLVGVDVLVGVTVGVSVFVAVGVGDTDEPSIVITIELEFAPDPHAHVYVPDVSPILEIVAPV